MPGIRKEVKAGTVMVSIEITGDRFDITVKPDDGESQIVIGGICIDDGKGGTSVELKRGEQYEVGSLGEKLSEHLTDIQGKCIKIMRTLHERR